jgi:hypothetical protein
VYKVLQAGLVQQLDQVAASAHLILVRYSLRSKIKLRTL